MNYWLTLIINCRHFIIKGRTLSSFKPTSFHNADVAQKTRKQLFTTIGSDTNERALGKSRVSCIFLRLLWNRRRKAVPKFRNYAGNYTSRCTLRAVEHRVNCSSRWKSRIWKHFFFWVASQIVRTYLVESKNDLTH